MLFILDAKIITIEIYNDQRKFLMDYRIAIIGLGYMGLPLAVEFGKKYPTIGYDIAQWRIDELREGIDRTLEVDREELLVDIKKRSLSFTTSLEDIAECNIYSVLPSSDGRL